MLFLTPLLILAAALFLVPAEGQNKFHLLKSCTRVDLPAALVLFAGRGAFVLMLAFFITVLVFILV